MQPRGLRLVVFNCLAALLLAGCSTPTTPTSARLANSRYENEFFHFALSIPPGWTINNERQFETASKMGEFRQKTPAEEKKVQDISNLLLFTSAKPFGAPAASNPSMTLTAVDTQGEPNIHSTQDYELLVIQSLDPNKWKQLGMPLPVKLGAKEFYRVVLETKALGTELDEAFFARIEKGYVLILAVCAGSKSEVDSILESAGLVQKH